MESFALVVFFVWGLPILIAWHLGAARNRTGWMWGLFLGWLGVLIVAMMRPRTAADELRDLEAQRQLDLLNAKTIRLGGRDLKDYS